MKNNARTLPTVDILLATYIPEDMPEAVEYLNVQIQSLVEQDYSGPIRILVRDDSSFYDVKPLILNRDIPENIVIEFVEDDDGNLGYVRNFERLMELSNADIAFNSDQDDWWNLSKVRVCVDEFMKIGAIYGPEKSALVFHDAYLANENLEVIHLSMNQFLNGRFEKAAFNKDTPVEPEVHGFVMGMNRALIEAALPIDAASVVKGGLGHDGHILLRARELDAVVRYMSPRLAHYRRHGGNVSELEGHATVSP